MLRSIRIDAGNPGPMTGKGNHTYLLRGADGSALLVDAGVGERDHLAAITFELEAVGATLSDVLVTHGHHDHAAGAPSLAAAHPGAQFHKWPWPEEDARYPVAWQPLSAGQRFPLDGGDWLEALHLPGHSPDHVVFWHEESATLFSGDLVLPGATVVIQWSRGGDMGQYLESLRRAITLRPRRLCAAHGPDVDDPLAVLEETLQHRLARERQVAERLADGLDTVEAIVESIYHGLMPAFVAAARENVRAHLEQLRQDHRARYDGRRWKRIT